MSILKSIRGRFSDVPKGMSVMAVMGSDGDTKHYWDKGKKEEVKAAEDLFNTLTQEKKYCAYKIDKNGERGEGPIKKFNPKEEGYLFVPQFQGG